MLVTFLSLMKYTCIACTQKENDIMLNYIFGHIFSYKYMKEMIDILVFVLSWVAIGMSKVGSYLLLYLELDSRLGLIETIT